MTPQLKVINVRMCLVCTNHSVHIWLDVGKFQSQIAPPTPFGPSICHRPPGMPQRPTVGVAEGQFDDPCSRQSFITSKQENCRKHEVNLRRFNTTVEYTKPRHTSMKHATDITLLLLEKVSRRVFSKTAERWI